MAKKEPGPASSEGGTPKAKGKKKKGKEEPVVVEEEIPVPEEPEAPEPEPDQFTLTSYSSASYESLPLVVVEEIPKKKKKKKTQGVASEVGPILSVANLDVWSSDEFAPIKSAPALVEVVEEEQKKKKKPKGKKGKKKKEEVEEEEPVPDFKKPKKWKSMSKKEQKEWLIVMEEEWRAQRAAEKAAYIAGTKGRREAFARMQQETMERDAYEQVVRGDQLAATVARFQEFEKKKLDSENKKQVQDEWKQYLKCDGLPDPRVVQAVNTYLHVWRELNECDPDCLERRCVEVLPMLELLEEFVANPRRYSALQAQSFNEIRVALRAQLSASIEAAMYYLLRDIERRMKREDLRIASYKREFKAIHLNAWVAVRMPTRMKRENEHPPEPTELEFPELRLQVRMPRGLDSSVICVRAARTSIDFYSEAVRTFPMAEPLFDYDKDLYTYTGEEHVATYKLKNEQDAVRVQFYKDTRARIRELENFIDANKYLKNTAELAEIEKLTVAEPPEMPEPREHVAAMRAEQWTLFLSRCNYRTRTGEINLRRYRICGGVLHLDLLQQPPQPKPMRGDLEITILSLPKALEAVKYQVVYRAPPPPAPGVTRTPEEIEAEMKRVEAEYERLARVHIDLSPDVLWLEPPQVCQWSAARKLWTTAYINDLKYNEDKFTVTFRTGVLWPIGLATLKYSNLPFQGWEVKPDPWTKGAVLVSVTGLCVSCTWQARGSRVRLVALQHSTTAALQNHLKRPYSVKQMVRVMREGSCDMFPAPDAHSHMEGSCPKEWCLEQHLYHALAFLSQAYHFKWSRWNVAAGPRNIVMQFREAVDKKRETSFQTLLSTPLRCVVLKCTELSTEYCEEPVLGMDRFYPDLMSLHGDYASSEARRVARGVRYQLAETVYTLLREIKFCSFS